MPKSPVEQAIEALKKEGEERVLLIGNMVCIFAENVPADLPEDVAASMRLIGLSSDKAFNKETQQRESRRFQALAAQRQRWRQLRPFTDRTATAHHWPPSVSACAVSRNPSP